MSPSTPRLARALRHRNYRLFFSGQSVSLVGTWITRVATSWLVYRLTGSELLLGIVGFCGQIPTLLLTPLAGVFVDRSDKRRILLMTQVLSLIQSALLAVLTLSDLITVTHVLVLQLFQGAINAFDTPARQALVVDMVGDRQDVPNAIALNSSMVNGSRIVGPAIGGLIIAAVGEGWCFALDALSYVAVIGSILLMRLAPHVGNQHPVDMRHELGSAWRYVVGSLPIRSALLLLAIVSIAGVPYSVLMPAIAAQELGGGPNTLGLLMGATGVGALAGGLYLASRSTVVGLGKVMAIGGLTFGVALVLFSFARAVWVAAPLLAIAGAGFIVEMASTNTVIQTIVDERFRGRVMAFYTMAFFGTVPIGSLLSGLAAERVGAPMTIRLGGVICIVSALWFASQLPMLRTLVRPIYVERGIIVEPPADVGTTP
ncbi:MAG TPA: MFS transporter [Vicinamibacterales bacterium]|nr:MFS transporter [Vicinamibacterales bacterium]